MSNNENRVDAVKAKTKRNNDAWGTLLSGFKKRGANKAESSYKDTMPLLTKVELDDLWRSDGICKRAITCIAGDMTRQGFSVIGDICNIAQAELVHLHLDATLKSAIEMCMLYGGSAIYMGIDDGTPSPAAPVRVNSIKSIRSLKVFAKHDIMLDVGSPVDKDVSSPTFGMPERFTLHTLYSDVPVHRSRLLLFSWDGTGITLNKCQDGYWGGTSYVESIRKALSGYGTFMDALSNLAQESVIGKYSISNLSMLLAAGREEDVLNRLDVINASKSIINAILLDADSNESYTRDSLSFSGTKDVADITMQYLSGVTGIPVSRLFGRSPGGLNSTGEGEIKTYYDTVASYQKAMLTTNMQHLMFYIDQYKKSIFIEPADQVLQKALAKSRGEEEKEIKKGRVKVESDIIIEWEPLYQMTDKERADLCFTNAQADMYYHNMGALSAKEIRRARFLNGYNQYITVDTEEVPKDDVDEEEVDLGNEPDDEDKGKDKGKGKDKETE